MAADDEKPTAQAADKPRKKARKKTRPRNTETARGGESWDGGWRRAEAYPGRGWGSAPPPPPPAWGRGGFFPF
ncbi:MAG: hypothetical protein HZA68_11470 [Rhodovulum sp.]|nr:hypothetical protein [Rhodovulum sp.]